MILALDGALGAFSVALLDPQAAAPPRTARGGDRDALERGLGLIACVMDGTPWSAIERVAVGVGPGSFTGMRIAISYAKAIAIARRLPLVGVSSYDVLDADADPADVVAVSGHPGVVCARLRAPGAPTACGRVQEVADRIAAVLAGRAGADPSAEIRLAGDAAALGEALARQGARVRLTPQPGEPPALRIARLAITARAAATPHEVRPDFGELPATTPRAIV